MVTAFLQGAMVICALVLLEQLLQTCNRQAILEPYNGDSQQLHFVPHLLKTAA